MIINLSSGLLLYCQRQFLNLVLAMYLRLLLAFFCKSGFFLCIVVLASHVVIVMRFPKRNRCFCPLNVFVRLLLEIVQFQVTVTHNVVLTKTISFASLASSALWIVHIRAFLRCCKVMLLHVDVANDVIIRTCVLAGTEVPLFLLGVVWPLFQAFHLAFEINDVVSLLISKCAVLIKFNS